MKLLDQRHIDNYQKAMLYDYLAQMTKYTNPNLHIKYYKEHLNHLQINYQTDVRSNNIYVHTRFINLTSCNINILLNNQEILRDVPTEGLSEYFILPAQRYTLEIQSSGDTNETLNRLVFEVNHDRYTNYIITESSGGIHVLPYTTEQYLPENETKLRFIHLAENLPSIDVRVKHGDVVFANLSYGKASTYLGLTPMAVELFLTVANSKNPVHPLMTFQLRSDEIYTALITGNTSSGLRIILIKD